MDTDEEEERVDGEVPMTVRKLVSADDCAQTSALTLDILGSGERGEYPLDRVSTRIKQKYICSCDLM